VLSGGLLVQSRYALATDTMVSAGGTEILSSAGTALSSTILSGGTLLVSAGGSAINTTISGGTLELVSGATTSGAITFAGSGTLKLDDPSVLPPATISGFGAGGSIDLAFLPYDAADTYSVSGDMVIISAGGSTYDLAIDGAASGTYTLSEGPGDTLTFAVCYYPGTGIRTPAGDVAVENLAIGDAVLTADGRSLPVRWIGRNTVSTRFADPLRVLPIRIRAGALAEGVPERDLLVSPEHAIFLDGILVQAGALVNGASITREALVPESFVYLHVELEEHALILAEGTPAESFVDYLGRGAFDNGDEHERFDAAAPIVEMPYPRAQSHRQVPREIHARLAARARQADRAA
jgi:autotransporter passenger strand-loop-strand repeat protein